ncbi:hypothetical protein H6776_00560 [Candidatus Nomurabacteria bacterium]|nr:hypothetical protein [Candidatus Nomurabacteria bacterium]
MFHDEEEVMLDLYDEEDEEDGPLMDEFGNLLDPDEVSEDEEDTEEEEEIPLIDADELSEEDTEA